MRRDKPREAAGLARAIFATCEYIIHFTRAWYRGRTGVASEYEKRRSPGSAWNQSPVNARAPPSRQSCFRCCMAGSCRAVYRRDLSRYLWNQTRDGQGVPRAAHWSSSSRGANAPPGAQASRTLGTRGRAWDVVVRPNRWHLRPAPGAWARYGPVGRGVVTSSAPPHELPAQHPTPSVGRWWHPPPEAR